MRRALTTLLLLLCISMANAQGIIKHPAPSKQTTPKTTTKKRATAQPKRKIPAAEEIDPSAPAPILGTSTYMPKVRTYKVGDVQFDMIEVQGGTFMMGATREQGGDLLELSKPAHQVTLSTYYIGRTEVTQELWKAVMNIGWKGLKSNLLDPAHFKGEKRPVEQVSWTDCQYFIKELNRLTGLNFRLPTEAEWEFAARGGTMSRGYKYSGSNTLDDVAWHEGNSENTTHDVGTKRPNELGLYDMTGNVEEWCNDWFDHYSSTAQTNPIGPANGIDNSRVLRGGCWHWNSYGAKMRRVAVRGFHSFGFYDDMIGLRLCLSE